MKGFTLIELMIVLALIAILGSIASVQFGRTLTKTRHAMTLGNLATLRGAISLFTAENGKPPQDDLQSLIAGSHLKGIPRKDTAPFHDAGNRVEAGPASAQAASSGDWFYFNQENEVRFGQVVINCDHQDLKGRSWMSY